MVQATATILEGTARGAPHPFTAMVQAQILPMTIHTETVTPTLVTMESCCETMPTTTGTTRDPITREMEHLIQFKSL